MEGRKQLLVISAAVLAAMILGSLWASFATPAGARIPIHWNVSGEIDGYGSKALGLSIGPVTVLLASALFAALPKIEPRKQHLIQSSKLYTAIWLCVLAIMSVIHVQVILAATGLYTGSTRLGLAMVGVLFITVGNYLGKSRSTFLMGIRTPWTLSSELSWRKTHRLGGWLFVALGIAHIVTVFAAPKLLPVVIVGGIVAMLVVVTVYSYLVWRTDPDRQTGSSTTPAR